MSIGSYDELLSRLKRWSNRDDLEDEDYVDFLHFAGNSANQLLRVPSMENTVVLEVSEGGKIAIPYDLLEIRAITANWDSPDSYTLERVAWDQFLNYRNRDYLETTRYFARQGAFIFIAPDLPIGTLITLHYYRAMPDIDPTEQTSWLLTLSPMSYLYGGLHYLHLFVQDEERAEYWNKKFQAEIDRIQLLADTAEYRGSSLTIRDRDTSRIS